MKVKPGLWNNVVSTTRRSSVNLRGHLLRSPGRIDLHWSTSTPSIVRTTSSLPSRRRTFFQLAIYRSRGEDKTEVVAAEFIDFGRGLYWIIETELCLRSNNEMSQGSRAIKKKESPFRDLIHRLLRFEMLLLWFANADAVQPSLF